MKIATIKNVQELFPEVSKSTAATKIRLIRDALNKPKPKIITMDEFCQYYDIHIQKQ